MLVDFYFCTECRGIRRPDLDDDTKCYCCGSEFVSNRVAASKIPQFRHKAQAKWIHVIHKDDKNYWRDS